MAIDNATEWDVRTTGNNANGGGFKAGASGTDYSQQDSPQVTYTDLVIDGATNTKLTSAANPFSASHVGNVLHVTGGTGFTAGWYQVASVAGAVATMDRAVGTVGSTGGAGKLGGAMATYGTALAVATAQNTVHIKTGTYTQADTVACTAAGQRLMGYASAHGDMGSPPTLKTTYAGGSDSFILYNGGFADVQFLNLVVDGENKAHVRGAHFGGNNRGSTYKLQIKNCPNYGAYSGQGVLWNSVDFTGNGLAAMFCDQNCVYYNCSADAQAASVIGFEVYSNTTFIRCRATANTNIGFSIQSLISNVTFIDCDGSVNTGASISGWGSLTGCFGLRWINCIGSGNGSWGWATLSTSNLYSMERYYCASGLNSSGDSSNALRDYGSIALTASPYTASSSSAGGDYSLNNDAGGGALLRGAGLPAYCDVGALQHADSGQTFVFSSATVVVYPGRSSVGY